MKKTYVVCPVSELENWAKNYQHVPHAERVIFSVVQFDPLDEKTVIIINFEKDE